MQVSSGIAKSLFQNMAATQTAGTLISHYSRVSALHMSAAELDALAVESLTSMLMQETCLLHTLDISHTKVGAAKLTAALTSNSSLTSLDVRGVPSMSGSFEAIGDMLLLADSKSRLAHIRCDAFEVLEGEILLSLREQHLEYGAVRLLTGLLKNNRTLQDLDFAATGLKKAWAATLVGTLTANTALRALHFDYNADLDPASQAELDATINKCNLDTTLHF